MVTPLTLSAKTQRSARPSVTPLQKSKNQKYAVHLAAKALIPA
jgi:hypothetical protein